MTNLHVAGPLPGTGPLDEPMRALDRYCWELTGEQRKLGAILDRDPDAIGELLDQPVVQFGRSCFMPPEYRTETGAPEVGQSCQATVIMLERAAYGDPNLVLACPGPSLAGAVIQALADQAQRDRFYSRLAAAPVHTFFGLTEPAKGSAVTELCTTLRPAPDGDGWLLTGEKRYIGNGARAPFGVVFCRRSPGPWGIEAVLVDADSPGFRADLLPSLGLRGARISWQRFDAVWVPAGNLLGAHLRPSRRGLHGALHGLYRFRPGIAAMALGCAQAACDYLLEHRPTLPAYGRSRLDGVLDRIAAVRGLTHRVAVDIDHGVVDVHRIGAVKAQAADVAIAATGLAAELLGPASLIEHPWLEKTCRDVRAFEIMEGTTNLHRLSVFQGLLKDSYLTRHAAED